MHVREHVQLAGLVAFHAPLLFQSRSRFPAGAVERYWTSTRCRQDDWTRALRAFQAQRDDPATNLAEGSYWIQPVLEEILTAEILVRVWAAVCHQIDLVQGVADAGPVAKNVLDNHQEARHRVLDLMLHGGSIRVEQAVNLNRLRQRNEAWTDSLLALVGASGTRAEWAFDSRRVRRLVLAHRQPPICPGNSWSRSLVLATLATAFPIPHAPQSARAEYNRRIGCSVLACLPPTVFDGTGLLMSSRQSRIAREIQESQGELGLASPEPYLGVDRDDALSEPDATRYPRRFGSR